MVGGSLLAFECNMKTCIYDELKICDLAIRAIIGLKPSERRKRQSIVINVTMYADLKRACQSDHLDDSIDYSAIKQSIVGIATESKCLLIERLAQLIAEVCLENKFIAAVRVNVRKPGALRLARCTEIEIVRSRKTR